MVSEKAIRDWYNQRHSTKGENAWRPYEAYRIFLDHLDVKLGRKLLDIGCGTGYLLKAANQRGLKTYGVDISNEGVQIAKKVSPNSHIVVGRGEILSFPDGFFDYITCLGSLEHFLDMERAVKEMIRVGKDNSLFCIVVPNVDSLTWIITGKKGTEQRDINEHLLSLKQWKDLFIRNGFDIVLLSQDKWFMKITNILSSFNPLGIVKRTVDKLFWIMLPLRYTYQFVFILRKA